jgi:nucleotide-binding universal stress UspA family protein
MAVPTATIENNATRKVLIAVDMSHYAEEAFDLYLNEMHKPGTEVVCFHSLERPAISDECDYTEGVARDAAMEGCESSAHRVQEKFDSKLQAANIAGKTIWSIRKKPGEAIVDAAKAEGATLIVLGTRGLGPIKRAALGSVSDYVLHRAHCPVIICSISSHLKIERRRSSSFSSE